MSFFICSPVIPLVTGVFAGDIRNVFLTDAITNQLKIRSFNSSEKISDRGVSYYGMISSQVSLTVGYYDVL